MNTKPLFDAIRTVKGSPLTQADVDLINRVLSGDPVKKTSQRGIDLIHSFESLKLDAYKDPGSKDGLPITIGWGSTRDANGQPIKMGTRWTKEQADAQFARDLEKTEVRVRQLAPMTTQNQFDALVGELRGGVPLRRKSHLIRRHSAAVVGHFDAIEPAFVEGDGDPPRAGIDRILDQFLERGSGPFDNLARGDAVDEAFGQAADSGHRHRLATKRHNFEAIR